ncbi:MAG: hypothetical protein M3O22_03460 [Pseudomonadota bacterium]|nr:hypothetical protein [Pseudomonadota bacterium]
MQQRVARILAGMSIGIALVSGARLYSASASPVDCDALGDKVGRILGLDEKIRISRKKSFGGWLSDPMTEAYIQSMNGGFRGIILNDGKDNLYWMPSSGPESPHPLLRGETTYIPLGKTSAPKGTDPNTVVTYINSCVNKTAAP